MMISIIVAVSEDLGIGKNNDLLWHLPEDLRRFRKLTTGNIVVMGRKTWFSLPKRPLKERRNIVITDVPGETFEGAESVASVNEAVAACKESDEIFIIGGGSIYAQFMPLADRLFITHVHSNTPADIFFPEIDPTHWKAISKEEFPQATDREVSYTYVVYDRIRK